MPPETLRILPDGQIRKMKSFDVGKYLRKNPPPECSFQRKCSVAVVIPAYDENDSIDSTVDSVISAAKYAEIEVAIIVVINYPAGAQKAESEKLYHDFQNGKFPSCVQAIYLPELTGGVGAARKAGMDVFISTVPPEDMEKSAIYSLDADTVVARDYFLSTLPEILKGGAVSLPFTHQKSSDCTIQQAIEKYEAYLHRYVDKLEYAASPYAFFTIGSAFAVRCDSYLRAGGMKIRSAGEDFYFLQAVAKSSSVRQLEGKPLVFPSPRISRRVPFGTGPAVASLVEGKALNEIPDAAFEELKVFLAEFAPDEALKNVPETIGKLSAVSREFIVAEKFPAAWERIAGNLPDTPEKRQKAFHEWFDALKTLKFLHFFSDFSKFTVDNKHFKG